MARTIPLIRAAVLFPMIRWMKANGHDISGWLSIGGLDHLCDDLRERPVPLFTVFELFRMLAKEEGPAIPTRVITQDSLRDLGLLGSIVLTSRTPREALNHVVHSLPRYSTHEIVTLHPRRGGVRVQAGWSLVVDDETLHLTQQFTAALIAGLCLATGHAEAAPRVVSLRPHPLFGLEHLRPYFGNALTPSNEPVLTVDLDDSALDAPVRFDSTQSCDPPPPEWAMPKGQSSFSSSVFLAVQALRPDVSVPIEQIARLAGMSVRSFQRALAKEGSSFRSILDEVHRARVLETLPADSRPSESVAVDLGYSGSSSMARAVRRWTGLSPSAVKTHAEHSTDPSS